MKRYEYKIFNLSMLETSKETLDKALDDLGEDGWAFAFKVKDTAWVFMREKPHA